MSVARKTGAAIVRAAARSFSAQAQAAPAAAAASSAGAAAVDPSHKAWLETVSKYPVVIPAFEWTLEWALPTPVPLHQFEQSPVCVEVKDRNPDADALLFRGPNVVGGYPHFDNSKVIVTPEEHAKLMKAGVVQPFHDHLA